MPAKSASREKNKTLTGFFTQRSSASAPVPAASSGPMNQTTPPATRKRPATRPSKAAVSRQSPVNSNAPSEVQSSSRMATRKRPRSPDGINPSMLSAIPKAARRSVDSERPRAIVRVTPRSSSRNSPAQRSTPMKMHSNTLVVSPSDSSKQVVYSSQSDEEELALPIPEARDFGRVSVHTWRRKTLEPSSPSSPSVYEDAMELEPLSSSPVLSSPLSNASSASFPVDAPIRSAATSSSTTSLQTPVVASAYFPSSPDMNELLPLPPTPESIDPVAKTAKIIAAIKAKAYAADQSSDDDRPLLYRELEDSDDGDIIDELPLVGNAKGKGSLLPAPRTGNDVFSSPLSSVPSTLNGGIISYRTLDHGSPLPRLARTSMRTRKPAPRFRLPVTVAESSTTASARTSLPSNPRKSKSSNPLKALLREKELQDKRGTSSAALRLAEEAVRQGSRGASINSDTVTQLHLADEQAAWRAVRDSRISISPDNLSDGGDLDVEDRASKMLGTIASDAINKILARSKDDKGKEKSRDMEQTVTLDVSLWTRDSDEDMNVDSVPIPPLSGHPILSCLDNFFRSDDDSLVDSLLRAGALAAVPGDILLSNMPQFLNMAFFASSQVADAVSIALRDLWGLNPPNVQMPLAAILLALVQLGANPSILERFGLVTEHAQENYVSHETRLKALKRLLAIMETAGFAGAFASHDITNVVLSLVIMGLDPLTSDELRTQLNSTMDAICNHGATDCLLHDIHEKVLSFAKQLTAVNKVRLVSFFASGSSRTRRIAQYLAYGILVSDPITTNHQAPSLEPLILSVSPDAGSCKLFDVTNESTDYEELRYYVNILSVALIDIAPYVEEERATMKPSGNNSVLGSPSKSKKPPVPPLELLRRVLEVLQGKIIDTRAAHLDRSRAKAEIQRLTMRINYERMALIGIRPRPRTSTLKAYFSPQCS